LSSGVSGDDDEVLVRYKFIGTHKASEIRCTYLQYRNLKMLPNIEFCTIVKDEDDSEKNPS
jgi:hypothetical protein